MTTYRERAVEIANIHASPEFAAALGEQQDVRKLHAEWSAGPDLGAPDPADPTAKRSNPPGFDPNYPGYYGSDEQKATSAAMCDARNPRTRGLIARGVVEYLGLAVLVLSAAFVVLLITMVGAYGALAIFVSPLVAVIALLAIVSVERILLALLAAVVALVIELAQIVLALVDMVVVAVTVVARAIAAPYRRARA